MTEEISRFLQEYNLPGMGMVPENQKISGNLMAGNKISEVPSCKSIGSTTNSNTTLVFGGTICKRTCSENRYCFWLY